MLNKKTPLGKEKCKSISNKFNILSFPSHCRNSSFPLYPFCCKTVFFCKTIDSIFKYNKRNCSFIKVVFWPVLSTVIAQGLGIGSWFTHEWWNHRLRLLNVGLKIRGVSWRKVGLGRNFGSTKQKHTTRYHNTGSKFESKGDAELHGWGGKCRELEIPPFLGDNAFGWMSKIKRYFKLKGVMYA